MRRESREWLVGTGVIVLGTATLFAVMTQWGFVSELLKYLLLALFAVVAFLIIGIAFPLVVGEAVLEWIDGKEEEQEIERGESRFTWNEER